MARKNQVDEEFIRSIATYFAYYKALNIEVKLEDSATDDITINRIKKGMSQALKLVDTLDIDKIRRRLRRTPYKGLTINDMLFIPGGRSLAAYQRAETETEKNAIRYKAFYEYDEEPLLYRLIWGAGYRTRAKAEKSLERRGIYPLVSKQDYLSIPTLKPYTSAFRVGGGDGVTFIKNAIEAGQELVGRQMELEDFADVEKMRLPDKVLKDGTREPGNISYNRALLSYVLSCFRSEMKAKGQAPQYIAIRRADLTPNVKDEKGQRSTGELEKDLKRYQSVFQKATDGNYYAVLLTAGYDAQNDAFIFTSPYMLRMINEIEDARTMKDQYGNPKKTTRGNVKRKIAFVEDVASGDLKNARNQDAAADVIELVRVIAMSGKKGVPNISAAELMERNGIFKRRYMESSNKRQLLKRHFLTVWKYLDEYAGPQLRAKYPGIKLPNGKNVSAEWIPTPGTLKTMVFRFPH